MMLHCLTGYAKQNEPVMRGTEPIFQMCPHCIVTKQSLPSCEEQEKPSMLFSIHCDEAISYKDAIFLLGFHSSQGEIASVVPPSQ